MTVRLEGGPVAETVLAQARRLAEKQTARPPALVSVHLGHPTPFSFYVRQQAKAADRVGIHFRTEALPESVDRA
ncbi:MAG: bifunctional 5,10-methylenetetrahydrofolate dehydrogenase/5,10-methenyltetrahydrofolate cyclohydrolase, partial [Thermoplasmata archaeon]|nr:bifunctional 5,10-methylenetetrahydrofolate dehydrogenase/5,10-methenyltetrahydrofolate cyclohydrolase [Thermoplasmata archaeon]